jgi:hypothetical protein
MKKKNITGVLVLLIFAVFMVSLLLILLNGADLVQRITERDQKSYNQRTVRQYLTTRVHQADQAGAVSVRRDGQMDVLAFVEEIDGTYYETKVYCHSGYLREMYCQAGVALPPEFGEKILPVQNFKVSLDNSLLRITFELADGTIQTILLHLRSWKETIQ